MEVLDVGPFFQLVSGLVDGDHAGVVHAQVAHHDGVEGGEDDQYGGKHIKGLHVLVTRLVHPDIVARLPEVPLHLGQAGKQVRPQKEEVIFLVGLPHAHSQQDAMMVVLVHADPASVAVVHSNPLPHPTLNALLILLHRLAVLMVAVGIADKSEGVEKRRGKDKPERPNTQEKPHSEAAVDSQCYFFEHSLIKQTRRSKWQTKCIK